jgi:hypothetical protein
MYEEFEETLLRVVLDMRGNAEGRSLDDISLTQGLWADVVAYGQMGARPGQICL